MTPFWRKRDSLVEALLASAAERPEDWTFSEYLVRHRSGVEVWLSGGAESLGIYPRGLGRSPGYTPPWRDRRRLHRALTRDVLRAQALARLKAAPA